MHYYLDKLGAVYEYSNPLIPPRCLGGINRYLSSRSYPSRLVLCMFRCSSCGRSYSHSKGCTRHKTHSCPALPGIPPSLQVTEPRRVPDPPDLTDPPANCTLTSVTTWTEGSPHEKKNSLTLNIVPLPSYIFSQVPGTFFLNLISRRQKFLKMFAFGSEPPPPPFP